jgi:hypothetical protein
VIWSLGIDTAQGDCQNKLGRDGLKILDYPIMALVLPNFAQMSSSACTPRSKMTFKRLSTNLSLHQRGWSFGLLVLL